MLVSIFGVEFIASRREGTARRTESCSENDLQKLCSAVPCSIRTSVLYRTTRAVRSARLRHVIVALVMLRAHTLKLKLLLILIVLTAGASRLLVSGF